MDKEDLLVSAEHQSTAALAKSNETAARYGLSLSQPEMHKLARQRVQVLRGTGRVDFEGGVLDKLVYAFCDSGYLDARNYFDTLCALQEAFYQLKNETELPDDILIERMRQHFEGNCGGSVDDLPGILLQALQQDGDDASKETEARGEEP